MDRLRRLSLFTHQVLAAIFGAFIPIAASAQGVRIAVKNPTAMQRHEVVEVDARTVKSQLPLADKDDLVVKNAFGQEVAHQFTYDGKLLFFASVQPNGEARYTVTAGIPAPSKVYAAGRCYPERLDDIAWENDRTAWRLYGPALQRTGERAFGIDVWVKSTPELVVEDRYRTELSAQQPIAALRRAGKQAQADSLSLQTTYHYDHGNGCDAYKVGPSLGCGAPALMVAGELKLPYCYESYEILDNGPLRFTVSLTYPPVAISTDKAVVEHRVISLDKGSNFNKATVWYEGLSSPTSLAAGIVIHAEDTASVIIGSNCVLYADPTDDPSRNNFQIYTACLFPEGGVETRMLLTEEVHNGIAGHAVGVLPEYLSGQKFSYYFGSAWSANDIRSLRQWQAHVDETLQALKEPLLVVCDNK